MDAYCPPKEFVRFVRRAEELPSHSTVLAVTGYVHDEKPLWVTTTRERARHRRRRRLGRRRHRRHLRVSREGPRLGIPPSLGRLREFLAWLAKSGEPIEAVDIPKVVDVDRAEDLAVAEEMARS